MLIDESFERTTLSVDAVVAPLLTESGPRPSPAKTTIGRPLLFAGTTLSKVGDTTTLFKTNAVVDVACGYIKCAIVMPPVQRQ